MKLELIVYSVVVFLCNTYLGSAKQVDAIELKNAHTRNSTGMTFGTKTRINSPEMLVLMDKWIDTGCECQNYSCGCCAHLEIPQVGLNDTGCVNLTYLVKEYGISFTVTIDNLTIYNETISAHNPPPLCFGAPILKEYADLCIRFYDLDISMNKFSGCVELEARLKEVKVATYKLGCFHIGHISFSKKEKNPKVVFKSQKLTYVPKHFMVRQV